jgi:uncharacterized protein YjbI with pentapeptide repeats
MRKKHAQTAKAISPVQNEDPFEQILNYKIFSQEKNNKNCPKVLIDASLILDILLDRPFIFLDDALEIMNLVLAEKLNGYIAELGLHNIWKITKKLKSQEEANYLIIKLLNSFNVCKVNAEIVKKACDHRHHLNNFETGVQVECAKKQNLDAILTLRAKDFLGCEFANVFSPAQFLESYNLERQADFHKTDIYSNLKSSQTKLDLSYIPTQPLDTLEDKLSLFDGWEIEYFDLLCSKNSVTTASVVLFNTQSNNQDCRYSESAFGYGAIATLFAALDRAIANIVRPQHRLKSIQSSNLEGGVESSVCVFVVVQCENYKVRKFCVDRSFVKACLYAYVQAIKAIYNPSDSSGDNFGDCQVSQIIRFSQNDLSQNDILNQYKIGEREFRNANLRETDLVQENFSEIDLSLADLSLSNLKGINLSKARLTEAIFTKAILSEANLNQAILYRAKLNEADLKNSNLIQVDLSKAELIGADLSNANLSEADLTGANLSNANLFRADLTGATLSNTNLSNANLAEANLSNTNLSSANLTGVNLTTTQLDGANLSTANLSRADLRGLDLNTIAFCKPILTDTALPEIKFEIYGDNRIKRIIELFNQFDSDHYVIYAVNSITLGIWWNSDIGREFRKVNNELSIKGISIQRVFIVPSDSFSDEINTIIEEQEQSGIEVRCLSQDLAKNLHGFDLRRANFLVCKNLLVPENSFTTKMLINEQQQEETGYISSIADDIEMNAQRFRMIWNSAQPRSNFLLKHC